VTTPTSHGSLATQWPETHSGTWGSGVVSVSQRLGIEGDLIGVGRG